MDSYLIANGYCSYSIDSWRAVQGEGGASEGEGEEVKREREKVKRKRSQKVEEREKRRDHMKREMNRAGLT